MGFFDKLKGAFGGGADYYIRQFGLDPDEQALNMWVGYYVPGVSNTKKAAVAVAGALLGSVATVRGTQVSVVLTSKGRVAFGQMEGGGQPVQFDHPRPRVDIVGEGTGSLAGPGGMEPSRIIRFTLVDGQIFDVQLCASAASALAAWSAGS